ncbi:MAG TPA: ATP-binding cassette domain-containing protein, partial [Defluviitoga sp.]|nr:ATP-binding cassette domain-containing protein [Defluviitoga sp.]
MKPLLRVIEVTKEFPGVKALSNVSIDFYPGEVHAIVGENGAGKSTLMKIIAGVYKPTSGKIIF